ncbi:MAG: hypothetical protein Q9202_000372 [Teloschistes flavicans]
MNASSPNTTTPFSNNGTLLSPSPHAPTAWYNNPFAIFPIRVLLVGAAFLVLHTVLDRFGIRLPSRRTRSATREAAVEEGVGIGLSDLAAP